MKEDAIKNIKKMSGYFLSGLLALLPLTLAIFLVVQFIALLEYLFIFVVDSKDPTMLMYFSMIIIALIILVGFEVRDNQKLKIISGAELWLSKFPIIGKIMGVFSEFTDMVQGQGKFRDLGVARVPFAGANVLGLITNEGEDDMGEKEYTVFVVQGTFPPVGIICFYKEHEIEIKKDLTPADVFQMQITLGVTSHEKK